MWGWGGWVGAGVGDWDADGLGMGWGCGVGGDGVGRVSGFVNQPMKVCTMLIPYVAASNTRACRPSEHTQAEIR